MRPVHHRGGGRGFTHSVTHCSNLKPIPLLVVHASCEELPRVWKAGHRGKGSSSLRQLQTDAPAARECACRPRGRRAPSSVLWHGMQTASTLYFARQKLHASRGKVKKQWLWLDEQGYRSLSTPRSRVEYRHSTA